MTSTISATSATDTVFNYDKTDYQKPLLLLGQRPGLFDTVNRHYPEI